MDIYRSVISSKYEKVRFGSKSQLIYEPDTYLSFTKNQKKPIKFLLISVFLFSLNWSWYKRSVIFLCHRKADIKNYKKIIEKVYSVKYAKILESSFKRNDTLFFKSVYYLGGGKSWALQFTFSECIIPWYQHIVHDFRTAPICRLSSSIFGQCIFCTNHTKKTYFFIFQYLRTQMSWLI